MSHPYSGSASYIYTNDYVRSSIDSSGPDSTPKTHASARSAESLTSSIRSGSSRISSPRVLGSSPNRPGRQVRHARRESLEPLIYSSSSTSRRYEPRERLDEEDAEDVEASIRTTPLSPNRPPKITPNRPARVHSSPMDSARRLTFTPYDPLRAAEREQEEAEKLRHAGSWRWKIQKQIRTALRRLRRFLETF
ncbi:hypothetical protein C8R43DRAFT_1200493 [Mycena crocata]|nr:hypothetical protein C8R43DRAFT_1200493 [Mycena crocata]